jgi:small GTP-binding protein
MSAEEKNQNENEEEEEEIKVELLPEDYAQYDLTFKIIFIGDSGVGKSCLTSKAVKNNFEDYYQATVGFEFLTFNMKLDKTVIKLQIWDTCGQEIYKSLISNFYRNSSLAIIVYSIDNRESFEHAETWLKELKNQANPDVRIFLVGNKADLEELRKVKKEEGIKYKNDQKLDLFLESSAKTGYNARNVLVEGAKMLYRDYLKYREGEENSNNNNNDNKDNNKEKEKKIKDLDAKKSEKKGCC